MFATTAVLSDEIIFVDALEGMTKGKASVRQQLTKIENGGERVARFSPHRFQTPDGETILEEWHIADDADSKVLYNGCTVTRVNDNAVTYIADHYDTLALRARSGLTELPVIEDAMGPDVRPDLSENARAFLAKREAVWAPFIQESKPSPFNEETGLSGQEIHELLFNKEVGANFYLISDLMHPTESIYFDPIFDHVATQTDIRAWYMDIMGKAGNIAFRPIAPPLYHDNVSFQEFRQYAVLPNGEEVFMTRGAGIRRYDGGFVVYAQDYYDVALVQQPHVVEASAAAGACLTLEDILRYRTS